jgi:hypothetical protein
MKRRAVLISSMVNIWLLCGVNLLAQECHSLTGTWKMNPTKSFFAGTKTPDQQAEAETLRMTQAAVKISQAWNYQGSIIKGEAIYDFTTDGKDNPLTGKGPLAPQSVRSEWQNCTLIYWEKILLFGMFPIELENKLVITPGGKELTILQDSHGITGDIERRLVFDLQ